ncbi:hypothetical protein DERP_011585 [Dermatophagoides pteronyssinus]|uniref:Transmembrane protein n=1 Tax=Dermatophagoides pteronyssinus TaxID=6956 RepID=A0ABQ8JWC8_DERPT|nr:hypothetical protein DERP_011585 [Dermatophagoides pteronyssinus]
MDQSRKGQNKPNEPKAKEHIKKTDVTWQASEKINKRIDLDLFFPLIFKTSKVYFLIANIQLSLLLLLLSLFNYNLNPDNDDNDEN